MKKLLFLGFAAIIITSCTLPYSDNYVGHMVERMEESEIEYKLMPLEEDTLTDIIIDDLMDDIDLEVMNEKIAKQKNFKKISELSPEAGKALLEADSLLEVCEYDKAIELYSEVIELEPDFPDAWISSGISNFKLGNFEGSEKSLLKAVEIDKDSYLAHWYLAEAYLSQYKYKSAMDEIVTAYMLNRHNDEILNTLARCAKFSSKVVAVNRTKFPFRFTRLSDDVCEVCVENREILHWVFVSFWYAEWCMEPENILALNEDIEEGRVNLSKYYNLMEAIYTSASSSIRSVHGPTNKLSLFMKVFSENYITEYVTFEILESIAPGSIILQPDDMKERIKEYIKNCVVVKNRFVDEGQYYKL